MIDSSTYVFHRTQGHNSTPWQPKIRQEQTMQRLGILLGSSADRSQTDRVGSERKPTWEEPAFTAMVTEAVSWLTSRPDGLKNTIRLGVSFILLATASKTTVISQK